jgi:hypothetical protein
MGRIYRRVCQCLIVTVLVLVMPGAAFSADGQNVSAGRYRGVYTAKDFRMNRDAVKSEIPENDAYRIVPRVANADIWTAFPIPDDEQSYAEWVVTARLKGSSGPATGVGMQTEKGEYVVCVYPDGRGTLGFFEGKRAGWTSDFTMKNFAYPANISLWRDINGSVIARVNGAVVAVRLFAVDLAGLRHDRVTSVFFATRSRGGSGEYALYEAIAVEGWGAKDAGGQIESGGETAQ